MRVEASPEIHYAILSTLTNGKMRYKELNQLIPKIMGKHIPKSTFHKHLDLLVERKYIEHTTISHKKVYYSLHKHLKDKKILDEIQSSKNIFSSLTKTTEFIVQEMDSKEEYLELVKSQLNLAFSQIRLDIFIHSDTSKLSNDIYFDIILPMYLRKISDVLNNIFETNFNFYKKIVGNKETQLKKNLTQFKKNCNTIIKYKRDHSF